MVLVVKTGIAGEFTHEQLLDFSVRRFGIHQPVPLEDPSRVGIYYEDRPVSRIKQDTVGRLLPYSRYPQQPAPSFGEIACEHPVQVPAELAAEHPEKGLQPPGLDPEIPGGPDMPGQNLVVEAVEEVGLQEIFRPESPDSLLHVEPVCVLRQDGPDSDLEGRLPGPPVQVPEKAVQRLKDADEPAAPVH